MNIQALASLSQRKRALLQVSITNPPIYLSIDRFIYNKEIGAFLYSIEIGIKKGNSVEIHKVERRYSALFQFDRKIRPIFNEFLTLLDFPPKKYIGNKDPIFLQQRKEDLEKYLSNLNRLPGIIKNSTFLEFFELDPSDLYIR